MYAAGVSAFDYEQEATLDNTSEALPRQRLQLSAAVRQPLGIDQQMLVQAVRCGRVWKAWPCTRCWAGHHHNQARGQRRAR